MQGKIFLSEKYLYTRYFLYCKGLLVDDVGVFRDTVFQEMQQGAGFDIGYSAIERLEEATSFIL